MPSVEEIISTRDLEGLFRDIVSGRRTMHLNRHNVVRRIRAFGPLCVGDLEGLVDRDILMELEQYSRWSVLREIRRMGGGGAV